MLKKMKEYLEYRKNKRIAKRELVKAAATVLPVVRTFSEKKAESLRFFFRLLDSTKQIGSDTLMIEVLNILADKLATDESRLLEILQYMASLSSEDIQKILGHSIIKTMPEEIK